MKWFKNEELRCKCCGALPTLQKENMEALVREVLDPLREDYRKPIVVNSAYRCEKHNREVGGAASSQHMKGEAADITAGSPEENLKLARMIVERGKFDQLILYPILATSSSDATRNSSLLPRFVHVSWKRSGTNRRQILRKVAGRGAAATYRTVSREEVVGI